MIDQVYSPSDEDTTLTLLDPNHNKIGNFVLTTGDSQAKDCYLKTTRIIFKDDLCWHLEEPRSWQEWENIFLLSARLYGGFEGVEELYEACAGTELPLDSLFCLRINSPAATAGSAYPSPFKTGPPITTATISTD